MAIKLKTLKFNWLNKCNNVTMTLKLSYDVERSIGKTNFLLCLTERVPHGAGIVPVGKVIEKRNN